MVRTIDQKDKDVHKVDTLGGTQEMTIISEFGIYDATFSSHKQEAKEFKRWVYTVLKTLRQASGLEGFEVFRMLDKEHQREAMRRLHDALPEPSKRDYIKANTITDKAVSTAFGYPKMLKKDEMTPDMLVARQPVLDDTVSLMSIVDRLGLDLSVSRAIYQRWAERRVLA